PCTVLRCPPHLPGSAPSATGRTGSSSCASRSLRWTKNPSACNQPLLHEYAQRIRPALAEGGALGVAIAAVQRVRRRLVNPGLEAAPGCTSPLERLVSWAILDRQRPEFGQILFPAGDDNALGLLLRQQLPRGALEHGGVYLHQGRAVHGERDAERHQTNSAFPFQTLPSRAG